MECICGADLPPPVDPTATTATCSACGAEIDLRAAPGATVVAGGSVPLAPPAHELLGHTLGGGRYRIDSALGAGGMGTVYLGTQVALGRRVAIKVQSPELMGDGHFVERFRREASTLASLQHPHITAIHDVGVEADLHYIVMEYVPGPDGTPVTLRELMRDGPMGQSDTVRLAAQICDALHYAHARGIVHRDIKPENILIDEDGDARLADLGIARVGLGHETLLTLPGTTIGSLRYMSPEQKIDPAAVDGRSDLYSLGVLLYEMLVGHLPEGRFRLPRQERPELDKRLDRIVDRALQTRPEERYQTAESLNRDISKVHGAPRNRPPAGPRKSTRQRAPARGPFPGGGLVVVAGLLLAVAVVAVATGVLKPGSDDRHIAGTEAEARTGKPAPEGTELVRRAPDRSVIRDAAIRGRIVATGYPWRIREKKSGIEFVLIPPGSFVMGSPKSEGRGDEHPQKTLTLTNPFYLAATEVTQAQWTKVMGSNPSSQTKGDAYPVTDVNWNRCQDFLEKLNAGHKGKARYTLPTEAQWEYACRAGTTTRYWSGDSESDLARVGWYGEFLEKSGGNSEGRVHVVGEKKQPNPFGLHDMHGNVWEWCEDWYGKDWYRTRRVLRHQRFPGPRHGTPIDLLGGKPTRVLRGGSFNLDASLARSADRVRYVPALNYFIHGFRPARFASD